MNQEFLEEFQQIIPDSSSRQCTNKVTFYETGATMISGLPYMEKAYVTLYNKEDKIALCVSPLKSKNAILMKSAKGSAVLQGTIKYLSDNAHKLELGNTYITPKTKTRGYSVIPQVLNSERDGSHILMINKLP